MHQSSDLDKTFHFIMERIIATGKAPDYPEIAIELGATPDEGRKTLRKVLSTFGFPGWFYPNTDTIMSFAPFNIEPNNHRITIDGEQKWFGQ
jgi:hypothetical protein